MKLSCPCCNNEITPAETDHTYVIGIGEETCQETTQEHLQSSKSTRMASDKALGPYGVSLGIPDSKQLPDIRVETPEGSRLDLFRWQNTGMQTSRLMTENGRLPTALQLCILRWIMPLQNKANTKLFGSVKAVRNEQTRHMEAGWIIHPCSALRLVKLWT